MSSFLKSCSPKTIKWFFCWQLVIFYVISNLKIRYSIFLEEPNKTCDSSNTSATTTSIQPNLENSNSSSELNSSQSESAKAADDPENGERESLTPVSIQEEIGKNILHTLKQAFAFFFNF